jgi:tRNA G18 (ribose-2'-O)-methylase SpoU
MLDIIVIAHNIRSIYNVGSIFRTADGFGIKKIILSGYTPYPKIENDQRLPFIYEKISKQIHKTALGAEDSVSFEYQDKPDFESLKNDGYKLVALEQDKRSIKIQDYHTNSKIALLLGEEVNGINKNFLDACDDIIEIPMYGTKESFNVSVSAGIALYCLRFNK